MVSCSGANRSPQYTHRKSSRSKIRRRFMDNPLHNRRTMMDAARRFLFEGLDRDPPDDALRPDDAPPRLTPQALEKIRMSRSRERILTNLDEMYSEAFERAKTTGDQ